MAPVKPLIVMAEESEPAKSNPLSNCRLAVNVLVFGFPVHDANGLFCCIVFVPSAAVDNVAPTGCAATATTAKTAAVALCRFLIFVEHFVVLPVISEIGRAHV